MITTVFLLSDKKEEFVPDPERKIRPIAFADRKDAEAYLDGLKHYDAKQLTIVSFNVAPTKAF